MDYGRDKYREGNRGPQLSFVYEGKVAGCISKVINGADTANAVGRNNKPFASKEIRAAQADPAGQGANDKYERERNGYMPPV